MTWLNIFLSICVLICVACVWILRRKLSGERRRAATTADYWAMISRGWADVHTRLLEMRKEAKFWRDKWKAGAFELDATAMSRLQDCDCHLCDPGPENSILSGPGSRDLNRYIKLAAGRDSDTSVSEANSSVFITDNARQPSRIDDDVAASPIGLPPLGVFRDKFGRLSLEPGDLASSIPWEELS